MHLLKGVDIGSSSIASSLAEVSDSATSYTACKIDASA
jgi:hypothetical protein